MASQFRTSLPLPRPEPKILQGTLVSAGLQINEHFIVPILWFLNSLYFVPYEFTYVLTHVSAHAF